MYENASQLSKVYLKCNWAIDGLITKSEKAVMECSRPRTTFITNVFHWHLQRLFPTPTVQYW